MTKKKELEIRTGDYEEIDVDKGCNPQIRLMNEAIKIIEDLERDRKGLSTEQYLNAQEKYKYAIMYI